MVRKCCEFSQSALGSIGSSSVKFTTALARLMPSNENASISSWRDSCSRLSFGDQPSRHRKLTNACGRKPASRYVVTLTTGPCLRLESLVPSGATSSGRCANCGGCAPSASKIRMCLKVFER